MRGVGPESGYLQQSIAIYSPPDLKLVTVPLDTCLHISERWITVAPNWEHSEQLRQTAMDRALKTTLRTCVCAGEVLAIHISLLNINADIAIAISPGIATKQKALGIHTDAAWRWERVENTPCRK